MKDYCSSLLRRGRSIETQKIGLTAEEVKALEEVELPDPLHDQNSNV